MIYIALYIAAYLGVLAFGRWIVLDMAKNNNKSIN